MERLQLKLGGKEIVDSITKIVNEATSTYELRRSNFDKTYSAFQVDKCDPIKNEESESNREWRMPIDNPMLCMYSQGGEHKPWHGSFGKDIRDWVGSFELWDWGESSGTIKKDKSPIQSQLIQINPLL
ncbi:hypothetical protein [Chryseobacterium sp. 18068]|uniref:hypothetical protein n=1 Tax=Chryseobacterium sp. 18068 TaxID=2681414 RepID=UPI001359F07C|nr:hypothetical protein [Chryseobacterium sp. 18068]